MSGVFVAGWGAVSPAGWGTAALCETLARGLPLPIQPLARPGWAKPLLERPVPPPDPRPQFLAHPRMRRTSPISHYAVAAALEATANLRVAGRDPVRLGLVVCLQSGCVQYSCRFYEQALEDPATASPLLFPETVFAAPASHIAAISGNIPLVQTLVGDPATFLRGMALATDWLEEGQIDACLVVGAEENNWVRADALRHFEPGAILACGAGAVCLTLKPELSAKVELAAITDSQAYTPHTRREQAARAMRAQLAAGGEELLCDGLGGSPRADGAERGAWQDWTGPRLSLKRLLGEGHMAAAAWQCVAGCKAVASGESPAVLVSLVGCNQEAMGARLIRHC